MELVAQLNQTTKDQQEKIDRLLKETEELSAHSEQLDNAMVCSHISRQTNFKYFRRPTLKNSRISRQ